MNRPPKLAKFLLEILWSREMDESFAGDIEELFADRADRLGPRRSRLWYWREILRSIPGFVKESIRWRVTMFANYFRVVHRNMKRHKGYSFINIAGLAVGMAATILILLWVKDELGYDRFHANAERVYRVVCSSNDDGTPSNANGPFGLGPALERDFPEIVETVRLRKMGQGVRRYVGYRDKKFYESGFLFAEPSLFTVFDFLLAKGDFRTALEEPNSIVLTEEMAAKYFGTEDPLGQTLEADPYNDGNIMLFRVTGVVKNVPRNSHVHFDFLASYVSQKEDTDDLSGYYQHYTYVLLNDTSSAESLNGKLLDFLHRNWRPDPWYTISLQPLLDIHLHSRLRSEIEPTGNILYVTIFTAIAVLVLVIAGINFMNLTTARAVRRAKEVGIRKVVGAQKNQLVHQFLGESLVLSTFSAAVAVVLVIMAMPLFNRLTGKEFTLLSLSDPAFFLGAAAIALAVGLVSGIYPAFFLAAFQPVSSLKRGAPHSASGILLRKGLVVFQFALSIGIICSTLIVRQQLKYIRSRNLGYDKEQILVIPLNKDLRQNVEAFRNELLRNPAIENAATSSYVPTKGSAHLSLRFEGQEELLSQVIYLVDRNFLATYGIRLLAGANLGRALSPEGTAEFVVSELTTRELGYEAPEEAVGKSADLEEYRGPIVGVVNDINIYSLHRVPYSITYAMTPAGNHNYLSVRIRPRGVSEALEGIRRTWREMVPAYPLDHFFLDASFGEMHLSDKKMGEILSVFSALAIFVAGLGLFGLAAHTAEQRTKEIGVRKVLGASSPSITMLLSREFLLSVALANLAAWPVAYFVMHRWLRNFAFRTAIGWGVFLAAAAAAFAVSLSAVSYQSIRAAGADPIDSLRYE
jgi:putative ABC transport system permease protein